MKTCFLRGVIPAFTLSLILNLTIRAQSGPTQPDNSQGAGTALTEVTPKTPEYVVISDIPKVSPVHPALDFSLAPHASKLKEEIEFGQPEVSSKTAPRAFKATAYSLRGLTASGVETRPGVVAADPRVLPLGSIVEIKAGAYSGVYTVHDTGSAVKGNLVDVWLPSTKEARRFGRRNIKLQVIRYGPVPRTRKSR